MVVQKADVVIIGGGVIGASIFYQIAKEKVEVVLLEKSSIASGTSSACEGLIFLQTKKPGIHLKMAMQSADLFKTLEDELDYKIEYVADGAMVVIPEQNQYNAMEKFVQEQNKTGLEVKLLNSDEAREQQPALSETVAGSTFCSADARVNPILLTYGFIEAATRYNNAKVFTYTKVLGIKRKNRTVEEVITNRGNIKTNIVINAAGIYAPEIGAMVNLNIPIKPRRGQLMVTETIPNIIKGVLCTSNYIACKYDPEIANNNGGGLTIEPTANDNYLIGATREFVGFNKKVSYDGIESIARNLVSLLPAFRNVSIIRFFAGLRPYTEDGLPILGKVEGLEGFIMAAGHEGDGIALSPITGRLIAELVINGKTSIPLYPFRLSRFK
ncbi:MAG: FAD-binding oxidoreductase [Candidatus Atribacteria bacterium]|nr:FAD-binding oxidoreductase [Candidatus Atribacteria bacterium]